VENPDTGQESAKTQAHGLHMMNANEGETGIEAKKTDTSIKTPTEGTAQKRPQSMMEGCVPQKPVTYTGPADETERAWLAGERPFQGPVHEVTRTEAE